MAVGSVHNHEIQQLVVYWNSLIGKTYKRVPLDKSSGHEFVDNPHVGNCDKRIVTFYCIVQSCLNIPVAMSQSHKLIILA
jgi:hypothetical protein